MDPSQKILSDVTVYGKYAKHIPHLNRRETWDEITDRYLNMMREKYKDFPEVLSGIDSYGHHIRNGNILMSMRAAQFAGQAIMKNPARIYNCAYLPVDDYRAFSEIMFLLLGGTGCGYSVQYHHIDKLPEIRKPIKSRRYLVGDSIEGWSDAVKMLMKSYLGYSSSKPIFDFSDVRPKGSLLITAGGKAPGPEPLKRCLMEIEFILERKNNGDKLKPIEVHDIICHIANAVLAGGIRRAALISLFSFDDEEMITCKYGNWWELNEQRGRANNSAVILRDRITETEFKKFWKMIEASNAGEPGMYFTNDIEYGTNPCCEIALRPFSFCNLTEINANCSLAQTKEGFMELCKAASFFGTLQAGFTDFHYLRDIWKRTTEKDALIGVGITGIASNVMPEDWLRDGATIVKLTNEDIAEIIGINPAARTTTVKPSGTTSCVLGTSSGIHAWHDHYYIRRQRLNKAEALYTYLSINHPEILVDDLGSPNTTAIIELPQSAGKGIIRSQETALSLLSRVSKYNSEWVRAGYRKGSNTNNVSATVSIKQDEWESVGEWMWLNRHTFNGLSVLPYDGGTYVQAPFESISKEEFDRRMSMLKPIDLTQVVELEDTTNLTGEAACAGGACEINL